MSGLFNNEGSLDPAQAAILEQIVGIGNAQQASTQPIREEAGSQIGNALYLNRGQNIDPFNLSPENTFNSADSGQFSPFGDKTGGGQGPPGGGQPQNGGQGQPGGSPPPIGAFGGSPGREVFTGVDTVGTMPNGQQFRRTGAPPVIDIGLDGGSPGNSGEFFPNLQDNSDGVTTPGSGQSGNTNNEVFPNLQDNSGGTTNAVINGETDPNNLSFGLRNNNDGNINGNINTQGNNFDVFGFLNQDPLRTATNDAALAGLNNPQQTRDQLLADSQAFLNVQRGNNADQAAGAGNFGGSEFNLNNDRLAAENFFRVNDIANQQRQLGFENATGARGQTFGENLQGINTASNIFQQNLGNRRQAQQQQENINNIRLQQQLLPLQFAMRFLGLGEGGQQLNQALAGLNQSYNTNSNIAANNPFLNLINTALGAGGQAAGAFI